MMRKSWQCTKLASDRAGAQGLLGHLSTLADRFDLPPSFCYDTVTALLATAHAVSENASLVVRPCTKARTPGPDCTAVFYVGVVCLARRYADAARLTHVAA